MVWQWSPDVGGPWTTYDEATQIKLEAAVKRGRLTVRVDPLHRILLVCALLRCAIERARTIDAQDMARACRVGGSMCTTMTTTIKNMSAVSTLRA